MLYQKCMDFEDFPRLLSCSMKKYDVIKIQIMRHFPNLLQTLTLRLSFNQFQLYVIIIKDFKREIILTSFSTIFSSSFQSFQIKRLRILLSVDLPLLTVLKESCYYKVKWAEWARLCTSRKYSQKCSIPLKRITCKEQSSNEGIFQPP